MAISHTHQTILEKAAVDNGFSQGRGTFGDWIIFRAHAAPACLCLTATDNEYGIGTDHGDVARELDVQLPTYPNPPKGFKAWRVFDSQMLDWIAGEVRRLACSLPDEPLRQFQRCLAEPPTSTEVTRLRRERIGQNTFREALMQFWDKACAVTNLKHVRLLRASHIIPWSECESDEERLNVYNGLLLAAHLDAGFDAHLISFDENGQILYSPKLSEADASVLGFSREMQLRHLKPETAKRLLVHSKRTRER